jgi:phosphopantetheinyl transferase (holo-ACP synthase)
MGIKTYGWKDIEVSPGPHGKPLVSLHRNARRVAHELGITGVDVSISHSGRDAVAVAVAWGETR